MRRILKFETMPGPTLHLTLHLPISLDDTIIHVAEQHTGSQATIKVWVEVNQDARPGGAMRPGNEVDSWTAPERVFVVVATGDEIPDNYRHRGTAVCSNGAYIWHLYEVL